jgi:hypothetical protein
MFSVVSLSIRIHSYIEHLYETRPEPNYVEKFAHGYEDYLQNPLQVWLYV